jgi:hypothetical protein
MTYCYYESITGSASSMSHLHDARSCGSTGSIGAPGLCQRYLPPPLPGASHDWKYRYWRSAAGSVDIDATDHSYHQVSQFKSLAPARVRSCVALAASGALWDIYISLMPSSHHFLNITIGRVPLLTQCSEENRNAIPSGRKAPGSFRTGQDLQLSCQSRSTGHVDIT